MTAKIAAHAVPGCRGIVDLRGSVGAEQDGAPALPGREFLVAVLVPGGEGLFGGGERVEAGVGQEPGSGR
jgi:hypothetical protein